MCGSIPMAPFFNHLFWLRKVLWELGFGFGLWSYESAPGRSIYNYFYHQQENDTKSKPYKPIYNNKKSREL